MPTDNNSSPMTQTAQQFQASKIATATEQCGLYSERENTRLNTFLSIA